jgi:hypothetical protein
MVGTGTEADIRFYAAPAAGQDAPRSPIALLSSEAQAAYVEQLSKWAANPAALRAALATPITPGNARRIGQPEVDRTDRLLVASLSRGGSYAPGDRIVRAVIHVRPRNFTFGRYSVVQTSRQTVDITQLTRSARQEAELALTGTPARVAITPTLTVGASQSSETVTNVVEAQEVLTVDILPDCLRIVQEGARNTDITGNIRLQMALVTETQPGGCPFAPPLPESAKGLLRAALYVIGPDLRFRNGAPVLEAGQAPGTVQRFSRQPLVADVFMEYVLRRIERGAEHYTEADHDVALVSGRTPTTCQVVLTAGQSLPPLYSVSRPQQDAPDMKIDGQTAVFTDYATAEAVAAWLNRSAGATPTLGGLPLDDVVRGRMVARGYVMPTDGVGNPCFSSARASAGG